MRFSFALLVLLVFGLIELDAENFYRISFTDKIGCGFYTDCPEDFLSKRAIERRRAQKIDIFEQDLPISGKYVAEVMNIADSVVCMSKWLNSIVVVCNSQNIDRIKSLPFVKSVNLIHSENNDSVIVDNGAFFEAAHKEWNSPYGASESTCKMIGCNSLHSNGYWGKGVYIAVLDAGFGGTDSLDEWFDYNRIKFTCDITSDSGNVFDGHRHGTAVLSVMLANSKGVFVGMSPESDYALIKSEIFERECAFEEDFWVRGAEIADSIGADILISSLGYEGVENVKSISSIGAQMASERGMVVITSCGNKGNNGITHPAHAEGVIAVAAVNKMGDRSSFSSKGYVTKSVVKPDVAALGEEVAVIDNKGKICIANGSSFAAPAVASAAALLWQAYPELSAKQLTHIIRNIGKNSKRPDNKLGYGVIDLRRFVFE